MWIHAIYSLGSLSVLICIIESAMPSIWQHDVLVLVWRFLGAEYITSDLQLALQNHAATRQFYNWIFQMSTSAKTWPYFSVWEFSSFPAHPLVTARLQGALTLVFLRAVDRSLPEKCKLVFINKKVRIHELVLAAQDCEAFRNYFKTYPHYFPTSPLPHEYHPDTDISNVQFCEQVTATVSLQDWMCQVTKAKTKEQVRDAELQALTISCEHVCNLQTITGQMVAFYQPTAAFGNFELAESFESISELKSLPRPSGFQLAQTVDDSTAACGEVDVGC